MTSTLLSNLNLIVLDASLGALDPATRQLAPQGVLGQPTAILLITH